MTPGMLNRFKALICKKNQHLLRVKLTKDRELFGYLREVGDDYFVLQEVRRDSQGRAKTTRQMIRDLALIVEYGEITPDLLPEPFPMFGLV